MVSKAALFCTVVLKTSISKYPAFRNMQDTCMMSYKVPFSIVFGELAPPRDFDRMHRVQRLYLPPKSVASKFWASIRKHVAVSLLSFGENTADRWA